MTGMLATPIDVLLFFSQTTGSLTFTTTDMARFSLLDDGNLLSYQVVNINEQGKKKQKKPLLFQAALSIWTQVCHICIYLVKTQEPTTSSSSCWHEGPVIALFAGFPHCIRERKTVAAWKALPAKGDRHRLGLRCEHSREMED